MAASTGDWTCVQAMQFECDGVRRGWSYAMIEKCGLFAVARNILVNYM